MEKIAAIVVTFNKKEILVNAINGILNQELLPHKLIIVDNNSNDGTPEIALNNGWINELPSKTCQGNVVLSKKLNINKDKNIDIDYIKKHENDGGAGGFYYGMKYAFEQGYSWLWLMDDDGVPETSQLRHLLNTSKKKNILFSNALVIDIENKNRLSFGLNSYGKNLNKINGNIIYNEINPFNGTLIHRNLIENIGFIKKEMFIWGDEQEYMFRAIKKGYKLATITKAIHYHPENKGKYSNVIPFFPNLKVLEKPLNFSHIYYRNTVYIAKTYKTNKTLIKIFTYYFIFFSLRFRFKELKNFIAYYFKGFRNDFVIEKNNK